MSVKRDFINELLYDKLYDGSRTDGQRSPNSKHTVPAVTYNPGQGARGTEDSASKRQKEKETNGCGNHG
ncbi:hypothetical protein RYX36_024060 [Vicia faba]